MAIEWRLIQKLRNLTVWRNHRLSGTEVAAGIGKIERNHRRLIIRIRNRNSRIDCVGDFGINAPPLDQGSSRDAGLADEYIVLAETEYRKTRRGLRARVRIYACITHGGHPCGRPACLERNPAATSDGKRRRGLP